VGGCPISEGISQSVLSLPFSPDLTFEQQGMVVEAMNSILS
jgi:dTDP-4-amino-4,6-dideoxygalactose transaminase